ncbi:ankyrin repeats (3 copies) domain-containing protein [Ditylenchus destructor]|nr:ankyrin repeats (3 copies) domain-containing protein [Ditylenchus destructor]
MMSTSTLIARDELDINGRSCRSSGLATSSAFGDDSFGTLRRSLRQISSFKNRLFRLPATPRLSRSKKVLVVRGEETTGWNFERAGSLNQMLPQAGRTSGQQRQEQSSTSHLSSPLDPSPTHMKLAPIANVDETNFLTGRFPHSPMTDRNFHEGFGGSCRLSSDYSRHRTRPSLPSFDPPDAHQARSTIHAHLRNLLPSPPPVPNCHADRNQQFLFLPNTSYTENGEMSSASWQNDSNSGRSPEDRCSRRLESPTQSTISLLNTQASNRVTMRSLSSSSASMHYRRQNRQSMASGRPSYPVNGLFHQPSLKSICIAPSHATASRTSLVTKEDDGQLVLVELKPPPAVLFSMSDFQKDGEVDDHFLGREWVFKELYHTCFNERVPVTLIQGSNGSGKSSVLNQLIVNSPFFQKNSNADTVDSGIVVGSTTSRNHRGSQMSLTSGIVAFHVCHLYSAATCSIPEFVRNIVALMCASPLLKPYMEKVCSDDRLYELATCESASLGIDPVELFRALVLRPLANLDPEMFCSSMETTHADLAAFNGLSNQLNDSNCLIVAIDAVDEAGFHRNDGEESIGWLLKQTTPEFPAWLRFVVSSVNVQPLYGLEVRTIRLDDADLDERVLRDSRIFVDYHLAVNPMLEAKVRERRCGVQEDAVTEFVEDILRRSRGNHLFLALLLRMIEEDRIRLKATSLSLLPTTLSQLYLLHFNLNFTSLSLFHTVSPILGIILASLRPLKFKELLRVINSGQSEPQVTEKELNQRLSLLSPMIVKLSSGYYVPLHQSFREWLLKESGETDYSVDIRHGHILLSLSLVRQAKLQPEQLFELGHHLLKANPHKYLQPGIAMDMPCDRGAQIAWIRMAAGADGIEDALLFPRNIYYPNSKVSRLLLSAGASANSIWSNGDSLLGSFAKSGNCDMIQLLLQNGANIQYVNPITGKTALIIAVEHKRLEASRTLQSFGADLSVLDREGKCALVHAAEADSLPLLSFLLEVDWKGESKDEIRSIQIKSAFEAAVRLGRVQICRYLLDCTDAVIDTSSAMCVACANGQSEVVQFLLSRGATLSPTQNWNGKSALICAVESGSWDLVVNVLNNTLVDLNTHQSEEENPTPLMVAARNGHVGLVDLLINRGAALDVADSKGKTALTYAVEGKHASTAALLIDRGADIFVKDFHGNTLIHWLAKYPNKCLINRLLKAGLSMEEKNNEELRAVEVAIKCRNHVAIDTFLANGARLRSLTWQIALDSDPALLLILTKKLLDDASILLRRKRALEALHRYNYALQKCNELLEQCDRESTDEDEGVGRESPQAIVSPISAISKEEILKKGRKSGARSTLTSIQPQLRQSKLQTLFAIAQLKRRNNELADALDLTEEIMHLVEDDETRFQVLMFRSKCFFDSRNVVAAREDAQKAVILKPDDVDVQNLLAVLTTSGPVF